MEDSSQLYSIVNCAFHTWHQCPTALLEHFARIKTCLLANLNCCSDLNEAKRSLPEWHFKGSSNKNTILTCIPFTVSVLEISLEDLVNDFLKVIFILFDFFSNFKLLFAHLVLRNLSLLESMNSTIPFLTHYSVYSLTKGYNSDAVGEYV